MTWSKIHGALRLSIVVALGLALADSSVDATSSVQPAVLPPGFVEEPPITGLNLPIAFDWTPDGRMFVGEKGGSVRLVKNNIVTSEPALKLAVTTLMTRGLLGLVIDPQFLRHPFIYVYYTTGPGSFTYAGEPKNRISRFTVEGDHIALDSEVILVDDIPTDGGVTDDHNGGDLHFGPDGMLYASTGYGGGVLNRNRAQDLESVAGKILRLDPATGYGPASNPFAGAGVNRQRVWAFGLRNPFRFGIDPESGQLLMNDVGYGTYEELDLGVAGANYGWPQIEGPVPPNLSGRRYPRFWYGRSGNSDMSFDGCHATIGGAFARGTNFPASLAGSYFFGDYGCGRIWHLAPGGTTPTLFLDPAASIVHLAFGPDGELYFSNLSQIHHIRWVAGNRPPTARATADVTTGALPLTVTFSSAGTDDPDHDALIYHWDFGDGLSSDQANPKHTYTSAATLQAVLTVTDIHASSSTALPIALSPGNNPPRTTIGGPANGSRFRPGVSIVFTGRGADTEDGSMDPAQLSWSVVWQSGPYAQLLTRSVGAMLPTSMPFPDSLASIPTSSLVITLVATDRNGAQGSISRHIALQTVPLQFVTQPPGLRLTLDGRDERTPVTITSAAGVRFTVTAPFQTNADGSCHGNKPTGWSDSGSTTHVVLTPELATTFTATFAPHQIHCVLLPAVPN